MSAAEQPERSELESVDWGTLALLAAWRAEDATEDLDELREADEEILAFKKSMNENRAAVGAEPIFP